MPAVDVNPSPIMDFRSDTPLDEAVMQTIGRASMCWESMDGAGVFDSTTAKDIGDELLAHIRANSVLCVQWFKNGDHPLDYVHPSPDGAYSAEYQREHGWEGQVVRYFRDPEIRGDEVCLCGKRMHVHGWIDQGEDLPGNVQGFIVCPGDWIVTREGQHRPVKF